jgi:threonine dehydrogenase-like Zn-dependent dehydrogenase
MKALVKNRDARGLWLEDVAEPELGINDVKVRVLLTGICGTDLHIYEWENWAKTTIPVPMVVGHEFVGEVTEVGTNVADFRAGELVSGEGHVITHRLSWRDYEKGFEVVRSGKCGKVILDWRDVHTTEFHLKFGSQGVHKPSVF